MLSCTFIALFSLAVASAIQAVPPPHHQKVSSEFKVDHPCIILTVMPNEVVDPSTWTHFNKAGFSSTLDDTAPHSNVHNYAEEFRVQVGQPNEPKRDIIIEHWTDDQHHDILTIVNKWVPLNQVASPWPITESVYVLEWIDESGQGSSQSMIIRLPAGSTSNDQKARCNISLKKDPKLPHFAVLAFVKRIQK